MSVGYGIDFCIVARCPTDGHICNLAVERAIGRAIGECFFVLRINGVIVWMMKVLDTFAFYGLTIDVEQAVSDASLDEIRDIDGVLSVRAL